MHPIRTALAGRSATTFESLGKVFVEYLSPLKRNRIKSKLLKQQREDQRLEQREGRR